MHHAPRAEFGTSGTQWGRSEALLAAIRQAHQILIAEMANMEALTRETHADRLRFSRVRWKLSQASLAKRTLCANICDYLRPITTDDETATIRTIRAADRELARDSATHAGRWSANSIQAGWADYCEASREIRSKMGVYLAMEQQQLFPILERAARLGK